jgi:hypothetical protein
MKIQRELPHSGNVTLKIKCNLIVRYGYENVTVKQERRLRVFENRLLGRDEVTDGWRGLHNAELHKLYSSSSIIRMIQSSRRWTGHVAQMGRRGVHICY